MTFFYDVTVSSQAAAGDAPAAESRKKFDAALSFFPDEAEIETKSRRNFFSQIRMEAIFFRKWNLERSIFGGKLKKNVNSSSS